MTESEIMKYQYYSGPVWLYYPISCRADALLYLGMCGLFWRWHTGKHGCSAPCKCITQPTSWPHVASPTWSSTEQVAQPATKRFHTSDWRALEACCRPWTWWCNKTTTLAGYATVMIMVWNSVDTCSKLILYCFVDAGPSQFSDEACGGIWPISNGHQCQCHGCTITSLPLAACTTAIFASVWVRQDEYLFRSQTCKCNWLCCAVRFVT